MAVISKGITLAWAEGSGEFETLENLQEIPELGGDVESLEITCLEDEAHRYTDGIKNYGESLAFKFLYESNQFNKLSGMAGNEYRWKVTLPDTSSCTFSGSCSVKLAGVGVNAALTYTLSIKPNSAMEWDIA